MLGFQCNCSVDNYDPAQVHRRARPRARKVHQCGECGAPIPIGAEYECVTGCWNDEWDRHRTCASCVSIREHFCPDGWIFGEVAEQIRQCLGFDYRDDPSEWSQAEVDEEDAANRARVLARLEKPHDQG